MELHIEVLLVYVYALQDFILVKYQFYWSFFFASVHQNGIIQETSKAALASRA